MVLDRLGVPLLTAQHLAELDQRVEVAAVPLEHLAEVGQGLVLASLENGDEAARVLLLDLLVLAAGLAQPPALDQQPDLTRAPQEEGRQHADQEEQQQRLPHVERHVAPQHERSGQHLAVGRPHRGDGPQHGEQQQDREKRADAHG